MAAAAVVAAVPQHFGKESSEELGFCDGTAAALDQAREEADPDLDPVWGLLVGDGLGGGDDDADDKPFAPEGREAAGLAAPCSEQAAEEEEEVDDDVDDADAGREVQRPARGASASARPISNVVDKAEVSHDRFPLCPDSSPPAPRRWDVKGCDAFVLDGVLTPEECTTLIAQADGHWSFWDDSEQPRVAFRNAHTVEVTHHELADRIWGRVSNLLNPPVSLAEGDPRFEVDIEGTWHPYAMNPKLLLSRYLEGGHFSPHTDGTTVVNFNRRTFYSCVLFLNSSPWGGHTRIYHDQQMRRPLVKDEEGRLTGDPALVLDAVPPAPGRMLVFYHRLMHEGVPAAEKYIIRTDVLCRRVPEICTEAEDVEAFDMYQEAQLLAEHGRCDEAANMFRRAFKRSPALASVYRS